MTVIAWLIFERGFEDFWLGEPHADEEHALWLQGWTFAVELDHVLSQIN